MEVFAALSDNDFINTVAAILFWIGGYAAAPLIFMATLGIFRNIAGMGGGILKQARGKLNEGASRRFRAERDVRKNLREEKIGLAAQRHGEVAYAGSRLTRRGRASRTAARQQISQRQAVAAINDDAYTWKDNGDLNRQYIDSGGDVGRLREMGVEEQDISRMKAMEAKYGKTAMMQAAHTQAIAGKGYKAHEYQQIWADAYRISGGDGETLASMVGRGRGAAVNAGLGAAGGASFTGTMAFAKEFADSQRTGTSSIAARNKYMDDVIDSSGPGTLFHPSMTNESIQQVSNRLSQRVKEAQDAYLNGDVGGEERYMRALADAAGAYDSMSSLPGGKGNIAADSLMKIDLGSGVTIRQEVERSRSQDEFLNRRRELSAREDATRRTGAPPPDVGSGATSDPTSGPT